MIKLKEKYVGKIAIVSGTRYDFRNVEQSQLDKLFKVESLSHLFESGVMITEDDFLSEKGFNAAIDEMTKPKPKTVKDKKGTPKK
jgi:hypothetical protein